MSLQTSIKFKLQTDQLDKNLLKDAIEKYYSLQSYLDLTDQNVINSVTEILKSKAELKEIPTNVLDVRIRMLENLNDKEKKIYYLTLKMLDNTTEIDMVIDKEEYNKLARLKCIGDVMKYCHIYKIDEYTFQLDYYLGKIIGLQIIEVRFFNKIFFISVIVY